MRILVVEDDKDLSAYVAHGLVEDGHSVDCFADGRDALVQAAAEEYDVLIVDRMLPGLDGLSLVRTLRSSGRHLPAIFLTSLGSVEDRVNGLEAGGDDYVTKPFAFSELLTRVHAVARRPPLKGEDTTLSVGDLCMDLIKRIVTRQGQRIDLQPREFRLLEVLMRNKGRVLTRTMLLERVWDFHFDPKTSVVETHISRLRAKVDKPFDKDLIQTVRSTGYSINAD